MGDKMDITLAKEEQIEVIMQIIEDGRKALKELVLYQWQEEYPAPSDILNDIALQQSYVLMDGDQIVGTTALDPNGEEVYDSLVDGEWSLDAPYLTVHRMAISSSNAKKGIGTSFLQAIEEIAAKQNIPQIRLDTHEDNVVMKRVAEKAGYRYCGKVTYGVGFDCVAFEKIL